MGNCIFSDIKHRAEGEHLDAKLPEPATAGSKPAALPKPTMFLRAAACQLASGSHQRPKEASAKVVAMEEAMESCWAEEQS